ncbi:hypothetical protein M9Y10_003419 [Tritrichomonas musculus]|uniref:Surface antigen BspA-like n=1 Tax=Tritrichomonas musculus TaxID=1915356 RepID=A0ABR2JPD3_9EUKA
MIVGKNKDDFDVLASAYRDIVEAKIPSFIKTIGAYSFSNCTKLQKIVFEENSELETIEKNAFSEASIKSITITSHVTKICEGAFSLCQQVESIVFEENWILCVCTLPKT